MGRSKMGRSILGILTYIALISIPLTLCGAVNLIFNVDFLWGQSRNGYATGLPGLTPKHFVIQYNNYSTKVSKVTLSASADQWIVIDYQLTVEKGRMYVYIYGPRNIFQRFIPFLRDFKRELVLNKGLSASGQDKITYLVREDGFYEIWLDPNRLTGSLDAWVDVR